MPLVQIYLLPGASDQHKKTLARAVTRAIQDTLDAPPGTIRVWIDDLDPVAAEATTAPRLTA